jgi:hypothetical protein
MSADRVIDLSEDQKPVTGTRGTSTGEGVAIGLGPGDAEAEALAPGPTGGVAEGIGVSIATESPGASTPGVEAAVTALVCVSNEQPVTTAPSTSSPASATALR